MRHWKCLVSSALLLVGLGVLAALGLIWSGAYDVAADRPHYALERWLFTTTRERSVAARADEIDVPANLDSAARIEAGAVHFDDTCAACHLRPGMEPNALYRGLNPAPPRLEEWSSSPAATFWAIKHGIRSTGMPAWGRTHDDDALWDIVAFQQQLPDMDGEEYENLLRQASGARAHGNREDDNGEGHDH